jgi:hypothetical protein
VPYCGLNPQPLDRPRDFFLGYFRKRGLPSIVVSALQSRSRRDARNVTRGNDTRPEDDMLEHLTAGGRFLGFDRGDWALLLGAIPLIALVTLLST